MNKKPKGPCQSTVCVQYEIYERLEDGRCSGVPVSRGSKLYTFQGINFDECKKRTDKFLEKLDNEKRQSQK